MTSRHNENSYVLSYRHDNIEEDRRLNSQHDLIKHAILGGLSIHPSINKITPKSAVADLGCGTGVWLDDIANELRAGGHKTEAHSAMFIGFDTNAHAFNSNPAPGVLLVEQDCTEPFETKYIGKFDLVNIRGLAYALPQERFSCLVDNAIKLLKPGGYLQWLETEARLFRAYPVTAEISGALNAINFERQERGFVPYLPHFMLRQLLSSNSGADVSHDHTSGDIMTILNFNLLPGGISRETQSEDTSLNDRFSEIVLESIKLLLNASLIRKQSQTPEEPRLGDVGTGNNNLTDTQRLMDFIDEVRMSDRLKMGGFFPQIIAQKTKPL